MVFVDDKRHTPLFSEKFWCERTSEREWHYCKYCYRDVPTFVLTEGQLGSLEPIQKLRCCWECGSGLDVMQDMISAALSQDSPSLPLKPQEAASAGIGVTPPSDAGTNSTGDA